MYLLVALVGLFWADVIAPSITTVAIQLLALTATRWSSPSLIRGMWNDMTALKESKHTFYVFRGTWDDITALKESKTIVYILKGTWNEITALKERKHMV